MSLPVIVLGAGGHAKVLIDTLRLRETPFVGIAASKPDEVDDKSLGLQLIGGDEEVLLYPSNKVLLVNALGTVRATAKRRALFEFFKSRGFSFASVIHPSAVISSDVKMSEGVQVMAGAIIQAGSHIGENTIVNTRATIDHDCIIGDHVHLAPGVTLSGGVIVGNNTHIGTGATIIQGVRIGQGVTVAAGAVVVNNVADNIVVKGIPARQSAGDYE